MTAATAHRRLVRSILILSAVLAGLCSLFLCNLAEDRSFRNGLFDYSGVGEGRSAMGTVESIEDAGRFITGQKLDRVQVGYPLPLYHDIIMETQAYVAHDISRTWKVGERVPIRWWSDDPECIRADLPSEVRRYRAEVKITYAASAFALLVCIGCSLDQARFKSRDA
jgi:hypothetical protein